MSEQQTVPFEATQMANFLTSDAGFDVGTVAGIVGQLSESQHGAGAVDTTDPSLGDGAVDDIPPTQPSPKTPMEVSRAEPAVSPIVAELMATPKVRGLSKIVDSRTVCVSFGCEPFHLIQF